MGLKDLLFGKKKLMSRDEFAQEILKRLKNTPTVESIAPSEELEFGFAITYVGDDSPSRINLEHVYRTYSDDITEEGRQETFEGCLRLFSTNPSVEKTDLTCMFPLVRHINYFDSYAEVIWNAFTAGEALPDDYQGPLVRPLIGDLIVVLGQETETTVTMVSKSDLNESGISVEAAWDAAFGNLSNDRFSYAMEQIGESGLCVFQFEDEMWLTPTLLLYSGIFHDFMSRNDIASAYIALPNRAGVLFIDDSLAGALELISDVSSHMLKSDHPQSEYIFRLRQGQDELELIEQDAG